MRPPAPFWRYDAATGSYTVFDAAGVPVRKNLDRADAQAAATSLTYTPPTGVFRLAAIVDFAQIFMGETRVGPMNFRPIVSEYNHYEFALLGYFTDEDHRALVDMTDKFAGARGWEHWGVVRESSENQLRVILATHKEVLNRSDDDELPF